MKEKGWYPVKRPCFTWLKAMGFICLFYLFWLCRGPEVLTLQLASGYDHFSNLQKCLQTGNSAQLCNPWQHEALSGVCYLPRASWQTGERSFQALCNCLSKPLLLWWRRLCGDHSRSTQTASFHTTKLYFRVLQCLPMTYPQEMLCLLVESWNRLCLIGSPAAKLLVTHLRITETKESLYLTVKVPYSPIWRTSPVPVPAGPSWSSTPWDAKWQTPLWPPEGTQHQPG